MSRSAVGWPGPLLPAVENRVGLVLHCLTKCRVRNNCFLCGAPAGNNPAAGAGSCRNEGWKELLEGVSLNSQLGSEQGSGWSNITLPFSAAALLPVSMGFGAGKTMWLIIWGQGSLKGDLYIESRSQGNIILFSYSRQTYLCATLYLGLSPCCAPFGITFLDATGSSVLDFLLSCEDAIMDMSFQQARGRKHSLWPCEYLDTGKEINCR